MKDKLQFYINGAWVESESNKKLRLSILQMRSL